MELRRAKREDIEDIINNRIEFLKVIDSLENEKKLKEALRNYLNLHIDDGTLIIYIIKLEENIISSAIVSIYEKIPTDKCLSGKMGTLLNVYTKKEYRHKGYSKMLLQNLIKESKEEGLEKIQLSYTDEAYELYRELGFKCINREMALLL